MKLIIHCCVVYLLVLAAPYWAGHGGSDVEELAERGGP